MKKLLFALLIAVMCFGCLVACNNENNDGGQDDPQQQLSSDLTKAKGGWVTKYQKALDPENPSKVGADFTMPTSVKGGTTTYTVTWKIEGTDDSYVKFGEPGEGTVSIDVNDKSDKDVNFTLVATITDGTETTTMTFYYTLAKFKEATYAEYVELCNAGGNKGGDLCVVKGIVTGIVSKSNGASYNCVYLRGTDGCFYSYNSVDDPKTLGIEIGMEVRATGKAGAYSGTYELMEGTYEIVNATKVSVEPVDVTAVCAAAESNKDSALIEKQSEFVTIKGVTILPQDNETSNGYYKFKLGNVTSYIRISSSVSCLTAEEKTAFIASHAEHAGWTANATGFLSQYDGALYLYPADGNAFEYISLPEKTDAEALAIEKENLSLTKTKFAKADEMTLPATGSSYDKVTITWESNNAQAVVADGKVTVSLGDDVVTIKLTATLTCGTETDTKEFEIEVAAVAKDIIVAASVEAGTEYSMVLVQEKVGKTLFLTGAMDGYYYGTSESKDAAAKVKLVAVEGGYNLMCGDKYMNITTDGSHINVSYDAEAVSVWTFDDTNKALITTVGEEAYTLGTRTDKTYTTISAAKVAQIETTFLAQLCTVLPKFTAVSEVADNGEYYMQMVQEKVEKTLFLTGEMSGYYYGTTEDYNDAAKVKLVAVEGGYNLMCGDKYMNITTDGSHINVSFDAEAVSVWTFDAESKALMTTVGEEAYTLGTRTDKTYTTISAAKVAQIETTFLAQLVTCDMTLGEEEPEEPVEKEPLTETLVLDFTGLTAKGSEISDNVITTLEKCASVKNVIVSATGVKIYDGNGSGGAKANTPGMLKFGISSIFGELKITFAEGTKINKVVVTCHDFNSYSADYPTNSNLVVVNGIELASPYTADVTPTDLTFEFETSTNEITITNATAKARMYVYSITIYVEDAE